MIERVENEANPQPELGVRLRSEDTNAAEHDDGPRTDTTARVVEFRGNATNPENTGDAGVSENMRRETAQLTTRFRARRFVPRPTVALPAENVRCIADVLPVEIDQNVRVVLVGELPFSGVAGAKVFADTGVPAWAEPAGRGHYLHGSAPVLHFLVHGRHRVEITSAAAWFGDGPYDAGDVGAVWSWLSAQLGERFAGAIMLSTPATTGRDCFARSLGGREFPVLSDELQQIIRASAGQGRIETFPAPAGARPGRFVEYDGRIMYAGCAAELGHGVPVVDEVDHFEPHARARYKVRFTVPADWSHVGILGVRRDDSSWSWPAEPGWSGVTWCDGAELLIAARAGWPFTVLQRITFPEHRGRPLDRWIAGLLTIIDRASELGDELRVGMVRHAVRGMILYGIGAMYGADHKVSRSGPPGAVPRGAGDVVVHSAQLASWTESRGAAWPELSHPEWTAAIWSRARARLLVAPTGTAGVTAGMLALPAGTVLGCRTDAIFATVDPAWPDDGRTGRFRLVTNRAGRYRWPANNTELHELKGGASATAD